MSIDTETLALDNNGFKVLLAYGISYRSDSEHAVELAQEDGTCFDDTISDDVMLALLLGDV